MLDMQLASGFSNSFVTMRREIGGRHGCGRCSFGKVADSLEKGTEHEDEYMISEKELLMNRFISVPKDMGAFNCGAFVAGIVRVYLEFYCIIFSYLKFLNGCCLFYVMKGGFLAVVTAHFVPVEGQQRPRPTILIKFAEEVLLREARLG